MQPLIPQGQIASLWKVPWNQVIDLQVVCQKQSSNRMAIVCEQKAMAILIFLTGFQLKSKNIQVGLRRQ